MDHWREVETQQRLKGGGGRAAARIAAKRSKRASQKLVFSDILFKSALAFEADRRDQWRALAAFNEQYTTSDLVLYLAHNLSMRTCCDC
eukprot:222341-Pleurochrysis_carterae.AAC.2